MSTRKDTSPQRTEPSPIAREPRPEELLAPLARLLGRQAARGSWAAHLALAPADPPLTSKKEYSSDDADVESPSPPTHGE